MMSATTDQLSNVFMALADPTRRAILARLADGDASVAELAAPFSISQPAISKHLKVLERAGLISRTRAATARLSHLEAAPMKEATAWMEQYRRFWESNFARLDTALSVYMAGQRGAQQRERQQGMEQQGRQGEQREPGRQERQEREEHGT